MRAAEQAEAETDRLPAEYALTDVADAIWDRGEARAQPRHQRGPVCAIVTFSL
jgi:hypothetical protein